MKTAFVTPDGSYEFIKIPFGMVNTWKQHLSMLAELFGRLSNAGLTVKPSKCVIGAESSEVIGYKILADGMKGLLQDNVEKIRNAWRPKTKKKLKRSLV